MTTTKPDVIRWGRERVRAGTWRGTADVACLTPVRGAPALSAAFVRRCLDELGGRGFTRVVTAALGPGEQAGFLAAGFAVEEDLHVLVHDLDAMPDADTTVLRRARPGDRSAVLAVDGRAFPSFWHLDDAGLADALTATPRVRFRVADGDGGGVIAYAVTGRAAGRGYLQRLAVEPSFQRRGLGRALVVDALRWLRRWRVHQAMVNTQLGNEAALALYEALGFRRERTGLAVLTRALDR